MGKHKQRVNIGCALTPAVIRGVLEQYDLEAVVLDDRGGAIARQLGVSRLPTSFLFDREGRLVDTSVGWHPERSLPEWKDKVEEIF